jgi:cation diffusion facilitator CzcD-associated flavoprotein CzcO
LTPRWRQAFWKACTPRSSVRTTTIDWSRRRRRRARCRGGITGIYQLYLAREAGFSVQLLEAGDGVGGTWYWNRYPGARFDSESYTYAYLFSRELFEDWEWQEHFAEQPEIERYLNHVVDRFDLRRHMRFGARSRRPTTTSGPRCGR